MIWPFRTKRAEPARSSTVDASAIVRQARAQDYRFESLIVALTTSAPFRMRETP